MDDADSGLVHASQIAAASGKPRLAHSCIWHLCLGRACSPTGGFWTTEKTYTRNAPTMPNNGPTIAP
eukprot:5998250-Pyramimonas_sp.AAC.1